MAGHRTMKIHTNTIGTTHEVGQSAETQDQSTGGEMSNIITQEQSFPDIFTGRFFADIDAVWPYDYAIIRPLWITREPSLPEIYQKAFAREKIPITVSKTDLLAIEDKLTQIIEIQALFGRTSCKDKIYVKIDDAGTLRVAYRDEGIVPLFSRLLKSVDGAGTVELQ